MNTTPSEKMQIEIWSDIMCPFCFIGKRLFDKALDAFAHKGQIQVVWKSYRLFPDVRYQEGSDACTVLAKTKGLARSSMQQAIAHVTALGRDVDIRFDFDRLQMVDTFDALRMVHWAAMHDLGNDLGSKMKERLFQAFFEEGLNLEDRRVLAQLGDELGMDASATEIMLSSRAYAAEVEEDVAQASQIGVRGIPFFVLDRKQALSGAQSAAAFSTLLHTAFDGWQQKTVPPAEVAMSGESCSLNGQC
ncbi:DsbA family oxidoreductase [Herbaspirillum sp. NPDC101397]|uniref:DsbA family oxidoreductase n=1 Tax=Herbaspirillum sp. NPDC101397 TaxID=3364006 RepID=UPI00383AFCCB